MFGKRQVIELQEKIYIRETEEDANLENANLEDADLEGANTKYATVNFSSKEYVQAKQWAEGLKKE